MTTFKKITVYFILSFLSAQMAFAQNDSWKEDRKVAILFGLTQPLFVNGFNIEGNYIHNRLIFDYSHGASLEFGSDYVNDELRDQGLVVYMPFSTGFGIGYRFTPWLNLRVETKWHRFQFYYEGDARDAINLVAEDANNFSVGLGLYGFFQPFGKSDNFLKGFTVAPSIRFWPTVSSSFVDNSFSYQNRLTGRTETINATASGIGLTPLIINVSIGYTIDVRKRH